MYEPLLSSLARYFLVQRQRKQLISGSVDDSSTLSSGAGVSHHVRYPGKVMNAMCRFDEGAEWFLMLQQKLGVHTACICQGKEVPVIRERPRRHNISWPQLEVWSVIYIRNGGCNNSKGIL